MADTEVSDYFRSNLLTLRGAIDDNDFKYFGSLEKNTQRIAFLLRYPEAHRLSFEIENEECKSSVKCLKLKNEGNKYFGCGNFEKALAKYSNAIILAPLEDLGILYGNRSAALYHLTDYELAIIDTEEAVKMGYPKELLYKLEDRRARCLLALEDHSRAMDAFKSALKSLDFAKLTLDKKQKLESDIRVMLAVMERGAKLNENGKTNKIIKKLKVKSPKCLIPKTKDTNIFYPAFSNAVEIKDAGGEIGRFGIATRDINPGEIVAVEKAHCAVLLGEYRLSHCHLCLERIFAPIPAFCCSYVAYCSTNCRNLDSNLHSIECKILGPLWSSGTSVTCLLALRAIIQRPLNELIKLEDKFNEKYVGSKIRPYKGSDYEALHGMVTHEDKRTVEDIFHRTFMACWLLRLLKTTSYFPENVKTPDSSEEQLSNEELFIGHLLLHNLQLLQFNAHEISELVKLKGEKNLSKAKNLFIGGGQFPSVALLNHSCNPGVIRYFIGTTMIVRAIRTIKAGMEISDNYGPIFAEMTETERKRKLRIQYWFDCNCEACSGHWPLLVNIDPRILRFKCETEFCDNILPIKTDTNEFMVSCFKCGKSTNILKGLKALQDTDSLFRLASHNLEEGDFEQALKYYLKILKLLDSTLSLPIKDFHLCQEGVRLCFLSFGNFSAI
ncbi:SET and MYND domain-containing protein 4-like isoform X2 [Leptopilina heterotoma]|uniref:SET and MYND domain-containing protein 4-like isoform X2 n=1 Tax=Leptopilina heterotoma TaxID=63436 RepID=UPI001CAA34C1|nr:SET and MYND domain-containing protein 4-like isoform X2 [Leptopilina heterotoma]